MITVKLDMFKGRTESTQWRRVNLCFKRFEEIFLQEDAELVSVMDPIIGDVRHKADDDD